MAAQYPVSFWVTIMPALLPHASCSIAGIFRLPSSSSCLLLPSSVAIAGSSCLLWKWGDVLHTKMATQGTRFHLSAWEAAAAWFSTCPNCRAHTAFMSNSLIPGVKFVACHCVHPSAGNAEYGNGRIWIIMGNLCEWCLLPLALCTASGFWGVMCRSALCCRCGKAAFGCRSSGSSGDISVLAELEASLIALMDLRMKINFPHYFPFDFSCSFAKQFKVGKMTGSVWFKRLLQPCGCPACITYGQCTFWDSFCHPTLCVAADHCSCFTVVSNTWFRRWETCGFHSSSLAEVI